MAHNRNLTLPNDSTERKGYPLFRGLWRYFPAALAGVARISKLGNDKHNPGEEMHHARGKSNDHADCILRHLMDVSDLLATLERADVVGSAWILDSILEEASCLAWRALAFSQELHERFGAPLAPGAKLPAPLTPVGEVCRSTEPLYHWPVGAVVPNYQGYPAPRCPICKLQECSGHSVDGH